MTAETSPSSDAAALENREEVSLSDQGPAAGAHGSGNGEEASELRRQLEEKEAQLRELQEQNRQMTDQLLRAMADLENVRRRGQKEREEAAQFGSQSLLSDFLPVMDNLERAISAAESGTVETLLEGVRLTLRQMQDTLQRHGVEPVGGAGQPFDAHVHEAIMRADPTEEYPAGTVVDEIRKGYTLRGRLLRPSIVKVAQEE